MAIFCPPITSHHLLPQLLLFLSFHLVIMYLELRLIVALHLRKYCCALLQEYKLLDIRCMRLNADLGYEFSMFLLFVVICSKEGSEKDDHTFVNS